MEDLSTVDPGRPSVVAEIQVKTPYECLRGDRTGPRAKGGGVPEAYGVPRYPG